jgi:hypothetical protein
MGSEREDCGRTRARKPRPYSRWTKAGLTRWAAFGVVSYWSKQPRVRASFTRLARKVRTALGDRLAEYAESDFHKPGPDENVELMLAAWLARWHLGDWAAEWLGWNIRGALQRGEARLEVTQFPWTVRGGPAWRRVVLPARPPLKLNVGGIALVWQGEVEALHTLERVHEHERDELCQLVRQAEATMQVPDLTVRRKKGMKAYLDPERVAWLWLYLVEGASPTDIWESLPAPPHASDLREVSLRTVERTIHEFLELLDIPPTV